MKVLVSFLAIIVVMLISFVVVISNWQEAPLLPDPANPEPTKPADVAVEDQVNGMSAPVALVISYDQDEDFCPGGHDGIVQVYFQDVLVAEMLDIGWQTYDQEKTLKALCGALVSQKYRMDQAKAAQAQP